MNMTSTSDFFINLYDSNVSETVTIRIDTEGQGISSTAFVKKKSIVLASKNLITLKSRIKLKKQIRNHLINLTIVKIVEPLDVRQSQFFGY